MVKKYRKKPVVVEAIQWTGDNTSKIMKWIGDKAYFRDTLYIKTLEGDHRASVGDYIIKGIKGEFYPCKPDIFERTYELVELNERGVEDVCKMSDMRETAQRPSLH